MTIIRPSKIRRTSSPPEASTPPYLETVFALPVGAAPLIAALCRDIGLPQIIDAEATWDRKRCILSPGDRITALVVNLLCEERRPLYKVADSFIKRETELLFGKGITPEHLNDDCLGRGLDTLWEIGPSRIFRLVSTAVRVKERLETSFVHFDTTTRILYGQYGYEEPLTATDLLAQISETKTADDPGKAESSLPPADSKAALPAPSSERRPANPAYGHSKDHRNDLKQLILAIAIDQYGMPVTGGLKDGNASDKVSNLETIEEILTLFPEELRKFMVYIADSALVTEKNLTRLTQEKMRFVSLLPGTFSCGETVRMKAWEEASWEDLGALRPQKDAASYRASEQSGTIGEIPYRLVVYSFTRTFSSRAKL
ncbi:MAG: IS1634 family transposase [Leptospirales bacterium]